MRMQHQCRSILAAIFIIFSGLLAQAQTTQATSKFLRFVPDNNDGGVLQTSIVTYRNSNGATVDLIAAIHVADAPYYADLNRRFRSYDSVLYEMVKPRGADVPRGPTTRGPSITKPLGWVGIIQQGMKNMLQLSFQLDQIDYTRPNFVHADLDVETFLQMQEDRGETIFGLMLQQAFKEMGNDQGDPIDVAALLTALQSPDRARQLKLVLARGFEQMDDMLNNLGGPDGTVLVTERNRQALKVLKQRLDRGDKKLAIFYGAAHLKEMEIDLTGPMGFKQVGDPQWLTAWNMTAPATQPSTQPR